MACLIVMVVDRVHPDPVLDALAHKVGDVVEVVPDDHQFSRAERMHNDWQILRLPLVSEEEGRAFMGGHFHPETGKHVRVRASRLDLTRLPADRASTTYADLDAARVIVDPSPPRGIAHLVREGVVA
jgi:hypothetical protein